MGRAACEVVGRALSAIEAWRRRGWRGRGWSSRISTSRRGSAGIGFRGMFCGAGGSGVISQDSG